MGESGLESDDGERGMGYWERKALYGSVDAVCRERKRGSRLRTEGRVIELALFS